MYILIIAAILTVTLTIVSGIVIEYKGKIRGFTVKNALYINLFSFAPVMAGVLILLIPNIVKAAPETATSIADNGLGFIAAALSTGLATIGAGYAVGAVASSALGAVSEDQSLLGKTLIFVGLAEGIAIYGLITSIMILGAL